MASGIAVSSTFTVDGVFIVAVLRIHPSSIMTLTTQLCRFYFPHRCTWLLVVFVLFLKGLGSDRPPLVASPGSMLLGSASITNTGF